MPSTPDDQQNYWVFALVLDGDAGPRRDPGMPVVDVIRSIDPPERRFELIQQARADTNDTVAAHADHILEDSAIGPLSQPNSAGAALEMKQSLSAEGYTILGWSLTVWRVYVARLSDDIGKRRTEHLPWVYVGQTSKSAEERLADHLSDTNASRWVRDYSSADGLMPELCEHLGVLYSQAAAEQAERRLAAELKDRGYSVKGGH